MRSKFPPWVIGLLRATVAAGIAGVGACGGTSGGGARANPAAALSAAAQLGEKIFQDQTLSLSGQQSCATCHAAARAFTADQGAGPDHGSPVPVGGPNMDDPGFRNAPSLRYASYTPAFFFDDDGGPNGGFFRDGRAATLADQAVVPFTTAFEMANSDAAAVIARLQSRPYVAEFTALYGASVLDDPPTALRRMGQAIAAYETEAVEFHPFSSKYDFWLKGETTLTAQELDGLALFDNPSKGNCAACHPSTSGDGVTPALFTDFSYDNLGVPRNSKIPGNDAATAPAYTPINSDDGVHRYYDLGVCGPLRDSGTQNLSGICGQFKVPTLRNIALTAPYFHNGRFASLSEAIGFYVRRDTNPNEFYPTAADGTVTKFDDLPALYGGQFLVNVNAPGSDGGYIGNVNTSEIPYDRHIGDQPALSAAEINDVITFLCALTDGYDPTEPSALVLPAQCQSAAGTAVSSTSRMIP
jgi:cytochrome c peroxidase